MMAAAAETTAKPVQTTPSVFQMPRYSVVQNRLTLPVILLFQGRQYEAAEKRLRQLINQYPDWPVHHYNLGAALARQGKADDAFVSLEEAIDRGFTGRGAMTSDPDLESLRALPEFQELLVKIDARAQEKAVEARARLAPKLLEKGRAIIDESNTIWDSRRNILISAPALHKARKYHRVYKGSAKVLNQLTTWYLRGEAAGNSGDVYDNRDAGHSLLSKTMFPQMTHVEYGEKAKQAGVHYGLNRDMIFNAITLGNSSTAITSSAVWRSLPRLAMTTPDLMARAYNQYLNDQLYVYPEDKDHDPKWGDLFPANTPYMLISQGSSGSDRPLLTAVSAILAAFNPEVKTYLRAKHLVMPTVQMIFRSSMKPVVTEADYLRAKAHPTVFDGANIDLGRMIQRAHNLRIEDVPPRIHLEVLEESRPHLGINYFGTSIGDEMLFNTPSAIARIVRSTANERRMVISVTKTKDPNGRPLKFSWKVLRGEGEKITITPLADDGSKVEIRVSWHDRRAVPSKPEVMTHRVDIGVFAHNGVQYSAPGFVSFYFPPNQARRYDSEGRILEVDYNPKKLSSRYLDPLLFVRRFWRDQYSYTDEGQLIGWERFAKGKSHHFTRHGARVVESDEAGRPVRAEEIQYQIMQDKKSRRRIEAVTTGTYLCYTYQAANDKLGEQGPCL